MQPKAAGILTNPSTVGKWLLRMFKICLILESRNVSLTFDLLLTGKDGQHLKFKTYDCMANIYRYVVLINDLLHAYS